jgi:hypothetical protein
MIVDCIIEKKGDYILVTDLTYKPKIKKLNIQIITPKGRIINTTYTFNKLNVYGEDALGIIEFGDYIFKIYNVEKLVFCDRNFSLKKIYQNTRKYN